MVLFSPQIFNLMKFDSYSRFLKSSLYLECLRAEEDGQPLPDPYQIPCSPAPSKHSASSDRSTVSTPKRVPHPSPPLHLLHQRLVIHISVV